MSGKTESSVIGNIISEGHSWHRYAHDEILQFATHSNNFSCHLMNPGGSLDHGTKKIEEKLEKNMFKC